MASIQETPLKKRQVASQNGTQDSPVDLSSDVEDLIEDDYETVATVPIERVAQGRVSDRHTDGGKIGISIRENRTPDLNSSGAAYARDNHKHQEHGTHPSSPITSPGNSPRGFEAKKFRQDELASSSGLHTLPLPAELQPLTQPTQQLRTASPPDNHEIQVLASSPAPPFGNKSLGSPSLPMMTRSPGTFQDRGLSRRQNGPGRLALSMAPAGTAYRAPNIQRGPARAEPIVIDSDDEVPFVGSSSDEGAHARDIKPTEPTLRRGTSARQKFSEQVKSFAYDAQTNHGPKERAVLSPSIDDEDEEVDSSSHSVKRRKIADSRKQSSRQGKTKQINSLQDIQDPSLRQKVMRMRPALRQWPINALCQALMNTDGDENEAVVLLAASDPQDYKSDSPEPDTLAGSPALPRRTAKQTLSTPATSLYKRYYELERPRRRRLVQGLKKRTPSARGDSSEEESEAESTGESAEEPQESVPKEVDEMSVVSVADSDPSDDTDSGERIGNNARDLLGFFNTCTVEQLLDMAPKNVVHEQAAAVLACRPFHTIDKIREVQDPNNLSTRPLGDKIVDGAAEIWNAYLALETLETECEAMGKRLHNEMSKSGIDMDQIVHNGGLNILSWSHKESKSPATEKAQSATTLRLFPAPKMLNKGTTLEEYQLVGVNWLDMMFRAKLGGILADDMGLGKTCQVIAFFARLYELKIDGPHIVVVPSSTLENWLREFKDFCSELRVLPYYGPPHVRQVEIAARIEDEKPNVIVTTYSLIKKAPDRAVLKTFKPVCVVFDEAHTLKNPDANLHREALSLANGCTFRLLLSGTPLQNNLSELVALLGFLMPQLFQKHRDALSSVFKHKAKAISIRAGGDEARSHEALLSEVRIAKAHALLSPFVLRRRKHQVLQQLPKKTRAVVYCEMTSDQAEYYQQEDKRLRSLASQLNDPRKKRENMLMTLRKAAIHPRLCRREYTDDMIRDMAHEIVRKEANTNEKLLREDLAKRNDTELDALVSETPYLKHFRSSADEYAVYENSGKIKMLLQLLQRHHATGNRTLVFSQFTQVLNILERVFEVHDITFVRLDGSTDTSERQLLMDLFTQDTSIRVFLLSTKAGGAGVNLVAATRVIIFDSSFNPQDDVQAENRAHRLGQKRPVHVVRLITSGTVEEQILALGETKLKLGRRVTGEQDDEEGGESGETSGGSGDEDTGEALEDVEEEAVENAGSDKAAEQKVLAMLLKEG